MHLQAAFFHVANKLALLSPHKRAFLLLGCTLVLVEVLLKSLAPDSKAYESWKKGLETVGDFWTAILLSLVYFLTVSLVSVGMRLSGKDPLDRGLAAEPTFWRAHEPNPLGVLAAARHQF